MGERCRHSHSWLLFGGRLEWCADCGAIRELRPVPGTPNTVAPYWTGYVYPRGQEAALKRLEQVDPVGRNAKP